MVVRLDLNRILTLIFRFNNLCYVGIGVSELIILISIDNVHTLYPNKYSLNYLPTQFRYRYDVYRYRDVYRYESNVNIF